MIKTYHDELQLVGVSTCDWCRLSKFSHTGSFDLLPVVVQNRIANVVWCIGIVVEFQSAGRSFAYTFRFAGSCSTLRILIFPAKLWFICLGDYPSTDSQRHRGYSYKTHHLLNHTFHTSFPFKISRFLEAGRAPHLLQKVSYMRSIIVLWPMPRLAVRHSIKG